MKKVFAFLFVLLFAVSFLSFSASAKEDQQEGLVVVSLVASRTDYSNEDFILHFTNDNTGEKIEIPVNGLHDNEIKASLYPEGEYTFTKCTLEKRKNIEFDIVNPEKKLVIDHDEITFYTTRIANDSKAAGTEEGERVKTDIKFNKIATIILVVLVPVILIWIILALIGRKVVVVNAIAQLVKHLMFCSFGFSIGLLLVQYFDEEILRYGVILFCTVFPFGFCLVSMLAGGVFLAMPFDNEAAEFRSQEQTNFLAGAGIVLIVFLSILAGILGIICCPIVIIRDIIIIVKSARYGI